MLRQERNRYVHPAAPIYTLGIDEIVDVLNRCRDGVGGTLECFREAARLPAELSLPRDVQTALLAKARLLEHFGPQLGRPHVDTLKDSKHVNMKELRFDAANGAWRAAFAFDPTRQAVILVAGDKSGGSERRFYRRLIATADKRFDEHLAQQYKGG